MILVVGATGLVGMAVCERLRPHRAARQQAAVSTPIDVIWDTDQGIERRLTA